MGCGEGGDARGSKGLQGVSGFTVVGFSRSATLIVYRASIKAPSVVSTRHISTVNSNGNIGVNHREVPIVDCTVLMPSRAI